MKEVDSQGLGNRLIELLRLDPGATVELQLLRNGSVLAKKAQES